jgi:Putative zinc-finger
MDHQEALRRTAVEKYLLNEMPQPERDEFEAHFFDCQECAADLRATAAFLDGARKEFKGSPIARPASTIRKKPRFAFLWRPAFISPAFATLLIVLVYQNAVIYPRFDGEIAQLKSPEILQPISLIGGNSRGGTIPSATLSGAQSILLSVDIPAARPYASYACVLLDPSGAIIWRVPVSVEQARDTVSIRIPAGKWASGDYQLLVQGYSFPAGGEPADVAHYRFNLKNSN